jgi:hypothetical protein
VFVVIQEGGIGLACWAFALNLWSERDSVWIAWLQIALVICAYLFVGFLLAFSGVFTQYRFSFSEAGMKVISWRGRQLFLWIKVRPASFRIPQKEPSTWSSITTAGVGLTPAKFFSQMRNAFYGDLKAFAHANQSLRLDGGSFAG